jgi:hypothetical protein
VRGPLNLANRPFRNEMLPALLLGIGGVLIVAGSLAHGAVVWSIARGKRHAREDEIRVLEAREEALRLEGASVRTARPAAATLAEWKILKELVDRRSFSWTGLFSRLEEILPAGVRIASITPGVEKGRMQLDIAVFCQTPELGLEFLRRLQSHGDFKDVYPLGSGGGSEGQQFHYTMSYVASARRTPAGSSDAPADGDAEISSEVNP